jgi:poly-gamma-glutamate synthesis protein (capsule biosynthesis protein)
VTIAFGGDVHAEGPAEAVLSGLGEISGTLSAADLAVINLETAIVTSPDATPEPKTYVFGAPPEVLGGLAASGVDVVTMANNHGLDFGQIGLQDSLAAAAAAPAPVVIGIGDTPEAAWRPYEGTINGRTVGIVTATDVLDDLDWAAVTGPGLASAKGDQEERLIAETTALATRVEIAVVFLHWGRETEVCPTDRQQALATRLVEAGAEIVVGSHAHVIQPLTRIGAATVAYGLGNFAWYHSREPSSITGVLTVTVAPDGTQTTSWQPARITSGLPVPSGPPVEAPTTSCD